MTFLRAIIYLIKLFLTERGDGAYLYRKNILAAKARFLKADRAKLRAFLRAEKRGDRNTAYLTAQEILRLRGVSLCGGSEMPVASGRGVFLQSGVKFKYAGGGRICKLGINAESNGRRLIFKAPVFCGDKTRAEAENGDVRLEMQIRGLRDYGGLLVCVRVYAKKDTDVLVRIEYKGGLIINGDLSVRFSLSSGESAEKVMKTALFADGKSERAFMKDGEKTEIKACRFADFNSYLKKPNEFLSAYFAAVEKLKYAESCYLFERSSDFRSMLIKPDEKTLSARYRRIDLSSEAIERDVFEDLLNALKDLSVFYGRILVKAAEEFSDLNFCSENIAVIFYEDPYTERRTFSAENLRYSFRFGDENLDYFYAKLKETEAAALERPFRDTESLLAGALNQNPNAALKDIASLLSRQLINGRFISVVGRNIGLYCRDKHEFLIVPAVFAYLSAGGKCTDFLNMKYKYSALELTKGDAKAKAGRLKWRPPYDCAYYHIIKCFETGEFVSPSKMSVNRNSDFFGLFSDMSAGIKGECFALIYNLSLTAFIPYLSGERDIKKYLSLLEKNKSEIRIRLIEHLKKDDLKNRDKAAYLALCEMLFKEKIFYGTLELDSFSDLFDYCSEYLCGAKYICTETVFMYCLGLLAEGRKEKVFAILSQYFGVLKSLKLKKLPRALYRIKDGYAAAGTMEESAHRLLLFGIENMLTGIKVTPEGILIGKVNERLGGGNLTVESAAGKSVINFKKTGIRKIVTGNIKSLTSNCLKFDFSDNCPESDVEF